MNKYIYNIYNINNMQSQYLDLPFNVSDTPEQIITVTVVNAVPADPKQAAHVLLTRLDEKLKSSQNQLYIFYDTNIVITHRALFYQRQLQWPEASSLQQQFNTEYKISSQNIYTEFWIRNYFNRLKGLNENQLIDRIDLAWETYTSIFQLEISRINFHPIMIEDMFQGFLNYYFYYRTKKNLAVKEDLFNVAKTKQLLKNLTKQIPQNPNQLGTLTTKQIAGYYSIIALINIAIHEKNYQQGINLVSKLSLRELLVYTKAFGALLSLFLGVGFCYFMLQDYSKAGKLCQTLIFFYQKNRKYYSKASCRQSIGHLYEKIVSLLCLSYIFSEEKPKIGFMDIFKNISFKAKDREGREKVSDCFYKMKQNDQATFIRIFTLYSYEYHIWDLVSIGKQKFKALREVTLNTVIQNYQRIELSKMSKILKLSQDQILRKLNSYSIAEESNSPWIATVMNPMIKQTKKIKVQIQDGIAIFDTQIMEAGDSSREWKRYREQLSDLKDKIKNM